MAFGTLSNPQFLDPRGAAGGEQSLGLFVDPPPPPPAWRWFKLFNSNVAVEIGPLHANLLPDARSCRAPAETFTPPRARPRLRSVLNPFSRWRSSFDSRGDPLTPEQPARGLNYLPGLISDHLPAAGAVGVYRATTCLTSVPTSVLPSCRPAPTAGRTSTTTRSTFSPTATAPSSPPPFRAGPNHSSLATKVQ